MRPILLALLVPLGAACDGKPVTGPEAQRVVAQAKDAQGTLIGGAPVFVDGVRLTSDKGLQELDPATVATVEIVKGAAGRRDGVYGATGGGLFNPQNPPGLTRHLT